MTISVMFAGFGALVMDYDNLLLNDNMRIYDSCVA